MDFNQSEAEIFVPDNVDTQKALARITHLCIAAHQDDIEILAYHGIAECFGRQDKWFGGVVVTDGSGSPRSGIYADYTGEAMQKVRFHEQRKAAYVGEYGVQVQLAYPSSAVKEKEGGKRSVCTDIKAMLEATQPEVVYLHNPADKHDTHIAVLLRCLEAIRSMPKGQRPKKVYGCEVWRDLDWLLDKDKLLLNVGDYNNIAAALIGIFDSQISGGKRYDLATSGRRLANATYNNPHAVDQSEALTCALDLTPLIENDSLSIEAYTLNYIERFKNDVCERMQKFT